MSPPSLEVVDLRHRYDEGPLVLDGISLRAAEGELITIVGPSGSGKSTLLRCIAGLRRPTSGEIRVAGRRVEGVPERLAIVFQDYGRSLFPWMSAAANVELGLLHRGLARGERRSRAADALREVGLATAADRHPAQLSGGQQQRVAIARALAMRPSVLLMDEPFGSVDAETRSDLQDLLLSVWRAHSATILFVTHDIDEAVYLADRVLVLSAAPARIAAELDVPLPRPRDQIETRAADSFVALRTEVARLLRRRPA